jgi:hypothetical protein
MPKTQSFVAGDGTSNALPSAYEVRECIVYANSGKEYNITDLVGTIEISESLNTETIDVEIGIVDGIQFLENAIISGNEKLSLKIVHKSFGKDEKEKKKYDLNLRIAEIGRFVRSKPGTQSYFLICFSEHMYTNAIKKLIRPFEGSIGSIISNICKKDLKIEKIEKINTETKGIIKGIFPRLSPLDAITWLNRNAFDGQTPFYFTDTLAKGIIYDSYKSICDSPVFKEYTMGLIETKTGTEEHYEAMSKQVIKLSSPMQMSSIVNLNDGAYASTLHTLDMSTKKYNKFFFDYNVKNPKMLNKNKPFSDKTEIDGIKYNQTKDSKHYFVSTNKNSFEGAFDTYQDPSVPTILEAQATNSNIQTSSQTITVLGDFDMTPGKKITLIIPKSMGVDASGTRDKLIGGNYIVTDITHQFYEEYQMILEIKKDSSVIDMSGESL